MLPLGNLPLDNILYFAFLILNLRSLYLGNKRVLSTMF